MATIERRRVQHAAGGKSLTRQADTQAADINHIMSNYARTGEIPLRNGTPQYGDFSDLGTFHECQDRVLAAKQDFMDLPSAVRKRCRNDLGEFLALVHTPEGQRELLDLGLVPERVPENAPTPAPEVNATGTPAGTEPPAEEPPTPE